jgi:hypothetical protein
VKTLREYLLPALTIIGGGGVVYYLLSLRDTTPVGLTANNFLEPTAPVGNNGDDAYSVGIVEGTFRENESSLTISSDNENRPLLVVFKNGTPIDAKVIDKPEPESIELFETYLGIAKEYGLDSEEDYQNVVDSLKEEESNTQSAEMRLRPSNTLQSHFVW